MMDGEEKGAAHADTEKVAGRKRMYQPSRQELTQATFSEQML